MFEVHIGKYCYKIAFQSLAVNSSVLKTIKDFWGGLRPGSLR